MRSPREKTLAKVLATTLSDIMGDLPDVQQFSAPSLSRRQDDLLLCALGFEPRCLSIPLALRDAGYQTRSAVYLQYATNHEENDVNRPELVAALERVAASVSTAEVDTPDFGSRLRSLVKAACSTTSDAPRVTFDVSVAANRVIIACMKVLMEFDILLNIVYAEALTYHPTYAEYAGPSEDSQTAWASGLEEGVSDVQVSREFPGLHLDPQPDALLLFPNFKPERSLAVISYIDPALVGDTGEKVIWLLGRPHLDENLWRMEALRRYNDISPNVPQYEVSTFDYRDTLKTLERIYAEKSTSYKLTLSPLGSKMQAVGVSLFCWMHPDVRVIVTVPRKYNAQRYSSGCRATWGMYFKSTALVRRLLEKVGTLYIKDQL